MGGKVFINKETNENPASRIPSCDLKEEAEAAIELIKSLFSKISFVSSGLISKESHGDVDIVALPKTKKSIEEFRNFLLDNKKLIPKAFDLKTNGRMDHFLIPSKKYGEEKLYQIDIIYGFSEKDYEKVLWFYSKPTTFNSVIGHFAKSIGYKFSDQGLFLRESDDKGQVFNIFITDDKKHMINILDLEEYDEKVMATPEHFSNWISKSKRFDSELFEACKNRQTKLDIKKDDFCSKVYDLLEKTNIKSMDKKISVYDNLETALEYEIKIMGKEIIDTVRDELKKREISTKRIIDGEEIMSLGFLPGKIIGDILKDVNSVFDINSNKKEILEYIQNKYKTEKKCC